MLKDNRIKQQISSGMGIANPQGPHGCIRPHSTYPRGRFFSGKDCLMSTAKKKTIVKNQTKEVEKIIKSILKILKPLPLRLQSYVVGGLLGHIMICRAK
jgi:hypothetical protein